MHEADVSGRCMREMHGTDAWDWSRSQQNLRKSMGCRSCLPHCQGPRHCCAAGTAAAALPVITSRPSCLPPARPQLYAISLRLARDIYETLGSFLTRHPPEVTYKAGAGSAAARPCSRGQGDPVTAPELLPRAAAAAKTSMLYASCPLRTLHPAPPHSHTHVHTTATCSSLAGAEHPGTPRLQRG